MHIKFIEIKNFRKLKSIRIDFSKEKTLFVGANNSGKTSAMVALRHFLVDPDRFNTNDFTLSNWTAIDAIGEEWEKPENNTGKYKPDLKDWENILPCMDVWLDVPSNEIHYVGHLLPSLEWKGGALGVRLRLEPEKIEQVYKEYILARKSALETISSANAARKDKGQNDCTLTLWPATMHEFLNKRLNSLFNIRAYTLDPNKCLEPKNGVAQLQPLLSGHEPIDGDPFKGLIRIDEIHAQRGFTDASSNAKNRSGQDDTGSKERGDQRILTNQIRSYYDKHLDPSEMPEPSDVDALQAVYDAQTLFDEKLEICFGDAFKELEGLGYPGITDPQLVLSTKIQPIDGLSHSSALKYKISTQQVAGTPIAPRHLPEQYNGLGYQNLISMVFRLMSFRSAWMQFGKAGKKAAAKVTENSFPPPLHLVLIEEPEAHLHVQVQQVFIRQAYQILRNHKDLKDKTNLTTQLVVSTHSSHVAHECEFSCLRYFRRQPAGNNPGDIPISTVVNLSKVFIDEKKTRLFVTRYLKALHCDLFFADAAIIVEGPAERILVPHFIRENFPKLNQSYITLLEIGGSHAHRLRPLIESLGLTTLVITDLDAAKLSSTKKLTSVYPNRNQSYVTGNATLRNLIPGKKVIDDWLDLEEAKKIIPIDDFSFVRIAYQHPVNIELNNTQVEALSNTFEDALIFENIEFFTSLRGNGLVKKVKSAIKGKTTAAAIGQEIFDALEKGDKAEFALSILYTEDPKKLKVPTYICEGLSWLEEKILKKRQEVSIFTEIPSVPSKKKVA